MKFWCEYNIRSTRDIKKKSEKLMAKKNNVQVRFWLKILHKEETAIIERNKTNGKHQQKKKHKQTLICVFSFLFIFIFFFIFIHRKWHTWHCAYNMISAMPTCTK